jgi:hypothetical protein
MCSYARTRPAIQTSVHDSMHAVLLLSNLHPPGPCAPGLHAPGQSVSCCVHLMVSKLHRHLAPSWYSMILTPVCFACLPCVLSDTIQSCTTIEMGKCVVLGLFCAPSCFCAAVHAQPGPNLLCSAWFGLRHTTYQLHACMQAVLLHSHTRKCPQQHTQIILRYIQTAVD